MRALVVVREDSSVVGLISRTNLLRRLAAPVVLVDHNERGQAVPGIEDAEVVGVIDHHRVADFQTRTPPFMRLEPVGATSTIVAKLFAEAGIAVPPADRRGAAGGDPGRYAAVPRPHHHARRPPRGRDPGRAGGGRYEGAGHRTS